MPFLKKRKEIPGIDFDAGVVPPRPKRIRRQRQEWLYPDLEKRMMYEEDKTPGRRTPEGEGNTYVSRVDDEGLLHMPCLDLDFDCELYESRTPGHYHLYLNKQIPWVSYVRLLEALKECGLVQPGWVEQAMRNGHTTLRKPQIIDEFVSLHERKAELDLT